MSALILEGIVKHYGSLPVLDGLNLEVAAGSCVAVLGPSGCGKTTLLRLIAGFEGIDAGTVRFDGVVVDNGQNRVVAERRRVGYVVQEGALFPHLNVARNVSFGLPRGRTSKERVEELLELVGLSGFGAKRPHELSGGEQQRVALARALAPQPAMILLDEPFSALDAGLRASLRGDVREVLRASGTTAVLVTHDQDEAFSFADFVAVMRDGHIAQVGTPKALYENPQDPVVAAFVGEANLLDGLIAEGVARCALGELVLDKTGEVLTGEALVLVRPEQIVLELPSGQDSRVIGTITSVDYFGHDSLARVSLTQAKILVRSVGHVSFVAGDRVAVVVNGPVKAWPVTY